MEIKWRLYGNYMEIVWILYGFSVASDTFFRDFMVKFVWRLSGVLFEKNKTVEPRYLDYGLTRIPPKFKHFEVPFDLDLHSNSPR